MTSCGAVAVAVAVAVAMDCISQDNQCDLYTGQRVGDGGRDASAARDERQGKSGAGLGGGLTHLDSFEGGTREEAHLRSTVPGTVRQAWTQSRRRRKNSTPALQKGESPGAAKVPRCGCAAASRACTDAGLGAARSATFVTTPRVPSAPMKSWRRS